MLDRFFAWWLGPSEEEGRAIANLVTQEERSTMKAIALREETVRLRLLAKRSLEQLLWCGGARDFQSPEGMASVGWERGVRPLIEDLRAELGLPPYVSPDGP